jgi:5-formyltetrahydrofolate cyclo-ligase
VSEKAALRGRFRALRKQYRPEERSAAGAAVSRHIAAFLPFSSALSVAAFAAFDTEIPTDGVIRDLRERGAVVVLPRVGSGHDMVFCEFSRLDDLATDRFGILSPDGAVFDGELDLILVPGLAFGRDGSRLGWGGGFYDRYLNGLKGTRIQLCGVSFDTQVVDRLPNDAHDVRMTHIATPLGVITCGRVTEV